MTIPQEFLKKIGTLVPGESRTLTIAEWTDRLKNAIDYFRYIGKCPLRFHKSIPRAWEPAPHKYNDTKMTLWLIFFNLFLGYTEYDVDELYDEIEEKEGYLLDQDYTLFWERTYEKQQVFYGRPSRIRFFL